MLVLERAAQAGGEVRVVANLGSTPRDFTPSQKWRLLLDSADAQFGGPGKVQALAPYQLLLYEVEP